jgi:hypothetical protein
MTVYLDCESKHPGLSTPWNLATEVALGKDHIDAATAKAEGRAIDQCFQEAMRDLKPYACKQDKCRCERRFSITFELAKVWVSPPYKLNGAIAFDVTVKVTSTMDVECKCPTPGASIWHGRPE